MQKRIIADCFLEDESDYKDMKKYYFHPDECVQCGLKAVTSLIVWFLKKSGGYGFKSRVPICDSCIKEIESNEY